MAIAEVRAFFQILTKLGEIVVTTSNTYYRASDELIAFPRKVEELNVKQQEWTSLLEKYTLASNDPVLARLTHAKEMLEKELARFEMFQNANCCLRLYKKGTFPSGMIANLDDVYGAFDGILRGMEEKHKADNLFREEANKRSAPFSFTMDEKYVPIMETVNAIRAALASVSPSATMVLLHGESGRGKSSMAKYLALKFQEEMIQGSSQFSGGIFFLACEKSTNKRLLMEKLWEDLGLADQGSSSMDLERSSGMQESDHQQMEAHKFDRFLKKVIAELESRSPRIMLIIIDNVWQREVVNALRISFPHLKYLVTSQKTDLCADVTATIGMAKPSVEEARKILLKHSGTWTEDAPVDPQVQVELDELIKQVEFNSLVLANLGAIMKSKAVGSYCALEPAKLKKLRRGLYHLLSHVDRDPLGATLFSETYNQTIAASMTLAIDVIPEEAKTMVYLMVMCENLTVSEVVLKVWFHRIYGKSIQGDIKYSSARAQLTTQPIITSESKKFVWTKEPWTKWSIHELRRHFIREKKKDELEEIIDKLMKGHPGEEQEDHDLVAVLCLLYGDASRRQKVQSISKLEQDAMLGGELDKFIKSFEVLLHPTADDGWQKISHNSAKEVMLCAFKHGKVHDVLISQLLRLPEAERATCYALQSCPLKAVRILSSLPKAVRILAGKISTHSGVVIDANACKEQLEMYLETLCYLTTDQTLQIVPDLPETLFSLLQQSQDVQISISLLRLLSSLTCRSNKYTRRIASVPNLLETLVRFLDKDKYPRFYRFSIIILFDLVRHPPDHQIRASLAAIPSALQFLMDLSPLDLFAALTLAHLARTPSVAEKIASTTATLMSLVELLVDDASIDVLQILLSKIASRKLICACPEAMECLLESLLELVREDNFTKRRGLSRQIAIVVVLITDYGEFEEFLAAGLGKYMALLAEGVHPTVRLDVLRDLKYLASSPAIHRTLMQSYPDVGDQLLRLMDEDADASFFDSLTDAFHTVVAKRPELGDPNRVIDAIRRYGALLGVKMLQEGAARALSKLALQPETCKLLDSSTVQKLICLVREGTSSLTVKYVTHTLQSILIKGNVLICTDQSELISGALKRYVALLEDDVEQNLKSESARALGMFASSKVNRDLIVRFPGALQKLSGIIGINGIPSVLSNAAYVVERITVHGSDLKGTIGSFFAEVLAKYVSLLADEVEEILQKGAVRALGKLAFNETARKLFCSIPDAVQLLVGRLKRSFVDKSQTLEELAAAIDGLLVSGKELDETRRSRILSEIVGRYTELLGDEVQLDVQVQALRALTTLCGKEDARRLVVTIPGVVDSVVGLLRLNVHEINPQVVPHVTQFILSATIGGTDLADKTTFLLDVTDSLVKLVVQIDGTTEWRFTVGLLSALSLLCEYPIMNKVVFSHPEVQVQIKKLLVDEGTPPYVFVLAASIAWAISFTRSDLDGRITAGFLSSAFERYTTLEEKAYDVRSDQSYRQEAARILDNLTDQTAVTVFDQVTISPMLVAWRATGFLEEPQHHTTLCACAALGLELDHALNMLGDCPDYESGRQSKPERLKLRLKALNNCVTLLQTYTRPYSTDWKSGSEACRAIELQLRMGLDRNQLVADCPSINQLVAECPSIRDVLLTTLTLSEETSIQEDIMGFRGLSGKYTEPIINESIFRVPSDASICTVSSIGALTLIDPSSANQMELSSSAAYRGRGAGKVKLRMYESALMDYDRALELSPDSPALFCERAYIRYQLSDNSGALSDIHQAVILDPDNAFCRCELGVLKRLIGNLDGALLDLDLAVDLYGPRVYVVFNLFKQRGYVKFLLGDEGGARADADKAMLCKSVQRYVPVFNDDTMFATSAVKYLHFAA